VYKRQEEAKGQVTMQIEQGKAQAAAQTAKMQEDSKQAIVQLQETTKKEIAQMQTKSAQDIAAANNETKMALEAMRAELTQVVNDSKLAGEEGKQQMTIMLERMRIVQDMLVRGRDHENAMELAEFDAANAPAPAEGKEPEEKGPDKDAMLIEVLGKLADSIGKPRVRRVKSRDAQGNIAEVEDI
jgi:hypothetical protein